MKYLNKFILSAALAMTLASGSLLATTDTFSFSYVFNDGPDGSGAPGEFHGTLTGIQAGDYTTGTVTVLSIDTLFVSSIDPDSNVTAGEVTGPSLTIYSSSADVLGNWNGYGSAVVSYDQNTNNFIFINGDFLNGDGYTGFAYLLNGSGSFGAWASLDNPLVSANDPGNGVWTLTNLTTPPPSTVPDGGATVGLLGLALIGFAALRRRQVAR